MSDIAIGIDLGTTFSSVGTYKGNKIDVIAFASGSRTLPSHVFFDPKKDEIIVGEAAKYKTKCIKNDVFDSKRIIGSNFTDPEVQEDISKWPFTVVNCNGEPKIQVELNKRTVQYSPTEISTIILKSIKQSADEYIGKDKNTPTKAVITVPAYFNNHQRENTIKAAMDANLQVLKIINEPTAAAIAYAHQKMVANRTVGKRKILIFDFGGGTFDVSIIEVNQTERVVRVLGTDGDAHLGGEDVDNIMVDHFIQRYRDKTGSKDDIPVGKRINIKKYCEKAKELLSVSEEAFIDCDFLQDADVKCDITKAEFDNMIEKLSERAVGVVTKLLAEKKINKNDIDDVVCVGGSSRIKSVQEKLKKTFGEDKICKDINASEAVAYGAAIVANLQEFNYRIYDVVTHSLSTDLEADKLFTMISKNSPIPCEYKQKFANENAGQTYIDVSVFEGEGEFISAKGVRLLGKYQYPITPGPARSIVVQITYKVDESGCLHVMGNKIGGPETEISSIKIK